MKRPQAPTNAAELSAVVTEHCAAKGYGVSGPETDKHGYLNFEVSIPGRDPSVGISFNSEVFILSFPEGYGWTEAGRSDDGPEMLKNVLGLVDAYTDPATREVEVKRPLRRPWIELRLRDGAVLRRRG